MTAEATDIEAPAKPGLVKTLLKYLIRLILVLVLVGAGFGAGYFYFANPLAPSNQVLELLGDNDAATSADDGTAPQRVSREVPETAAFETSYFEMENPLTTNLSGSGRYLQVGIGFSTQYDQSIVDNIKKHELAIRSDILAVLSEFTEEDVRGPQGRAFLSAAIRDATNRRLELLEGFGGIEDVFFPTFVLQ
ncbi:MAG: flagellar basal body-associated FliL family protein [Marivivens sp.]|nr:flagellar basal body-associated FliL family protein [Marivivens sp.]